jgi:hypothetical protein
VINKLNDMSPAMRRRMADVKRYLVEPWTRLVPKDPTVGRMAYWRHGSLPRVPITEVFRGIEQVDVTILRTFDREIGTSLDAQEMMVLAAVAKFTGAKNLLEIGTFDGNTALNLAANSPPEARVTTVDLPPDWNGQWVVPVPRTFRNVTDRKRVGLQYRDTVYAHKIHQVYCD